MRLSEIKVRLSIDVSQLRQLALLLARPVEKPRNLGRPVLQRALNILAADRPRGDDPQTTPWIDFEMDSASDPRAVNKLVFNLFIR